MHRVIHPTNVMVQVNIKQIFFIPLQTGDLGLDIGAQGEPLGYRPDGEYIAFFPPKCFLVQNFPKSMFKSLNGTQHVLWLDVGIL